MSDLADLFPGFASHWIHTAAGRLFLRQGGEGPPLLLLHGYPQSHVMWHKVAPTLAKHFTLVIADLPGYGWSDAPQGGADHAPYSKRAMAAAMVEVMEELGFARFRLCGHDRGGRVAYRLALDNPGRLEQLAVLDIVPTVTMWERMDASLALRAWHWPFLAQTAPLPELLIGGAAADFFDLQASRWVQAGGPGAFDPRALAHYKAAFAVPERIHAMCEDYRAGATIDLALDRADRAAGKKISCPVLALWGKSGFPSTLDALQAWSVFAPVVSGREMDCGHFLAEEKPAETAEELLKFFR